MPPKSLVRSGCGKRFAQAAVVQNAAQAFEVMQRMDPGGADPRGGTNKESRPKETAKQGPAKKGPQESESGQIDTGPKKKDGMTLEPSPKKPDQGQVLYQRLQRDMENLETLKAERKHWRRERKAAMTRQEHKALHEETRRKQQQEAHREQQSSTGREQIAVDPTGDGAQLELDPEFLDELDRQAKRDADTMNQSEDRIRRLTADIKNLERRLQYDTARLSEFEAHRDLRDDKKLDPLLEYPLDELRKQLLECLRGFYHDATQFTPLDLGALDHLRWKCEPVLQAKVADVRNASNATASSKATASSLKTTASSKAADRELRVSEMPALIMIASGERYVITLSEYFDWQRAKTFFFDPEHDPRIVDPEHDSEPPTLSINELVNWLSFQRSQGMHDDDWGSKVLDLLVFVLDRRDEARSSKERGANSNGLGAEGSQNGGGNQNGQVTWPLRLRDIYQSEQEERKSQPEQEERKSAQGNQNGLGAQGNQNGLGGNQNGRVTWPLRLRDIRPGKQSEQEERKSQSESQNGGKWKGDSWPMKGPGYKTPRRAAEEDGKHGPVSYKTGKVDRPPGDKDFLRWSG